MANGSKLQFDRIDGGGTTLLRLRGTIDADFPASEIIAAAGTNLVLDLSGVERITSFGVREWTRALDQIQASWVGFTHCRPIIVVQFNSVVHFGKRGQIISMTLPYVCDSCGAECEDLIDLRDRFDVVEADDPPTMKCPKCGEQASFDDMPDSYFSFVRSQGRPRVPDAAARLIAGKVDSNGPPLQVHKEVSGDVTALWMSGALDARARIKRVLDGVQGNAVLVMSGVVSVDTDGANRLIECLRSTEFRPFIARIPASVMSFLYGEHRAVLAGTLVSILIDHTCLKCRTLMRAEVMASDLSRQPWARICERCGNECHLTAVPDCTELGRAMRTEQLPTEVLAYLESRPVGYRPGDSSRPAQGAVTEVAVSTISSTSGSYEIVQPLGRGGMAEVFLARKKGVRGFEKRVVLKRMRAHLSHSEEFSQMFLQEARTAARINHPNVVQIYDLGFEAGGYFIAMEYVEGWDLSVINKAVRKLNQFIPVPIVCRLVADLCAGLHAAHTAKDESGAVVPIVHRDVSPHNLLVSTEGVVKLVDFGISKTVDVGEATQAGVVKGKVPYMAPEQIDIRLGTADHRVDVYQAGVVLTELLVGYSPFTKENEQKSLLAVLMNSLPDFALERPDCPAVVAQIARKALSLQPDQRHQTARELQVELEDALAALTQRPLTGVVARWLAEFAAEAVPAGILRPAGIRAVSADESGSVPRTPITQTVAEAQRSVGSSTAENSDLNKTVVLIGGQKP
jgi:serine/threonine protein kinase